MLGIAIVMIGGAFMIYVLGWGGGPPDSNNQHGLPPASFEGNGG